MRTAWLRSLGSTGVEIAKIAQIQGLPTMGFFRGSHPNETAKMVRARACGVQPQPPGQGSWLNPKRGPPPRSVYFDGAIWALAGALGATRRHQSSRSAERSCPRNRGPVLEPPIKLIPAVTEVGEASLAYAPSSSTTTPSSLMRSSDL